MSDVVNATKKVLGNVYIMYMKSHSYHWNYVGPNFPQYHKFFGDLYAELFDSLDGIAEHLRAIDSFVPGSLSRLVELSDIKEDDKVPGPNAMFANLEDANDQVMESLVAAYEAAEDAKEYGLANFLQDRIEIHKKHHWMIRATQMGNKSKT